MGKFIGPGYVRVGPVTAGPFGIGCLIPTMMFVIGLYTSVRKRP